VGGANLFAIPFLDGTILTRANESQSPSIPQNHVGYRLVRSLVLSASWAAEVRSGPNEDANQWLDRPKRGHWKI
jgi:hypothetical protein